MQVREGLSIFGGRDDLNYFSDDSGAEDEGMNGGFSSNGMVATRVLPRHVAIERLNMARRRRNKAGIVIPDPASGNS